MPLNLNSIPVAHQTSVYLRFLLYELTRGISPLILASPSMRYLIAKFASAWSYTWMMSHCENSQGLNPAGSIDLETSALIIWHLGLPTMMKTMLCRLENEFPSLDLGRATFIPYYQTYFIFLFLQNDSWEQIYGH